MLHRGEKPELVKVPDFAERLPEGIRRFTSKGVYDADETQHLSFLQGSGHGGSHPHLAHEFISSIVEGREPLPNASHKRQLDDDRHLCPRVGDEGRRAHSYPAVLKEQRSGKKGPGIREQRPDFFCSRVCDPGAVSG